MTKIVRILWFCILLSTGVFGQEREVSSHGYIDLEFEYDTEEKVSTFDGKHLNQGFHPFAKKLCIQYAFSLSKKMVNVTFKFNKIL